MQFSTIAESNNKDKQQTFMLRRYQNQRPLTQEEKAESERLIRQYEDLIVRFAGEVGAQIVESMRETAIGICTLLDRPADEIMCIVHLDVMLYVTQDIIHADEL